MTALSCLCSALLALVGAGKLPDPEVKIEVLHRPFICHRKSKYGDMLLVHQEGYFENGTLFHSRWVPHKASGPSSQMEPLGGLRKVLQQLPVREIHMLELLSAAFVS